MGLGADLRGQSNALPFTARQRRRAPIERQVSNAHVIEESQPSSRISFNTRPAIRASRSLSSNDLEDSEHIADRKVDCTRRRRVPSPSPRGSAASAAARGTRGTRAAFDTARDLLERPTSLLRTGGGDWESRPRSCGRTDRIPTSLPIDDAEARTPRRPRHPHRQRRQHGPPLWRQPSPASLHPQVRTAPARDVCAATC